MYALFHDPWALWNVCKWVWPGKAGLASPLFRALGFRVRVGFRVYSWGFGFRVETLNPKVQLALDTDLRRCPNKLSAKSVEDQKTPFPDQFLKVAVGAA